MSYEDTKQNEIAYIDDSWSNYLYSTASNASYGFLNSLYYTYDGLIKIKYNPIVDLTNITYTEVSNGITEFSTIAIQQIPNAFHEAIILDAVVSIVIGGALMFTPLAPATSILGFTGYVGFAVAGATTAYTLRATTHEYFKNSEYEYTASCAMGIVAGAIKYDIKSLYKPLKDINFLKESAYGALNNFLYEILNPVLDQYVEEKNEAAVFGSLLFIEGLETFLQVPNKLAASAISVAVAGLLDFQLFAFLVKDKSNSTADQSIITALDDASVPNDDEQDDWWNDVVGKDQIHVQQQADNICPLKTFADLLNNDMSPLKEPADSSQHDDL
ncbi:MAG: hypothetical protein ACI8ZF_000372 [Candidatus Midichloriaceae bacterium]|jgi:hypothetical protein